MEGTHSDSGSGRTPHLNDVQYTIQYVALGSIIGSSSNMCKCGGKISVGGNGRRCRRSSDGSGGHINGSKILGHAWSFTLRV